LSNLVAEGKLDAMVTEVLPFKRLLEGLEKLKAMSHSGKIVVVMD
jgi:NADPH:quinone reductase